MNVDTRLSKRAVEEFAAEAKVGLLATVNGNGEPHISLITTLQAKTPRELIWGQFCEGLSKHQIRDNPSAAFLVMNAHRQLWRGTARWTHEVQEGEDHEALNHQPMFRYNAYFGIHTVHHMELATTSGMETLNLPRIIAGSLAAAVTKVGVRSGGGEAILTPWARQHINKLTTLKFLATVGEDGYPSIVPMVPIQAADSRQLVFSPSVYHRELSAIREGSPVAVFALSMQMESVLMRGRFEGYRRPLGPRLGVVALDWVYNSMPPKQGQIYPRPPLEAVHL